MSRDLATDIITALDDDVIYPFFAIELLFDGDNTLRLWTGLGTLTHDSQDWVGTGTLLNISTVEEASEIAVKGATVTLSGIPSSVISLALSQPYQGRVCNLYFGMFTVDRLLQQSDDYILLQTGSKILLDTDQTSISNIFSGYMDQMNILETPSTSTIELVVENRLIDLQRARIARFTSEYQKSIYPTDLGLDFVEDLQDKDISWGRSSGS
jgi:hypothetical protein